MNLTNIKYKNKIIYNKNEGNKCYNTGLTFSLCIQLKIVPYLYMRIILPLVKVRLHLFCFEKKTNNYHSGCIAMSR
jgi:hypothetical protein